MSIRHVFQYYCYVVRTSVHFETLSTQPINLVVEEISRNKSVVQTPVTLFHKSKIKTYLYQTQEHINFDKIWGTIFPYWYNAHDLSWCEVFFGSLSQYLFWDTCCKNCAYNDGTFLRKEVKLLSVRHNF